MKTESGKTRPWTRGGMLLLLTMSCAACSAEGEAPAVATPASVASEVVDRLPLQPGYYVSTDTACAEASNATLHLMSEEGDGYGGFTTPPYFCEFKRIEKTAPSRFRVTEACGGTWGEEEAPQPTLSEYEILSDTSYRARNQDGWESSARRCPRQQLPVLWRGEDIGSFVD